MNSYADALESYLIPAEEGFMDVAKKAIVKLVEGFRSLIQKIISFVNKMADMISKATDALDKGDAELENEISKVVSNLHKVNSNAYRNAENAYKFYKNPDSRSTYPNDNDDISESTDSMNELISSMKTTKRDGRRISRKFAKTCINTIKSEIPTLQNIYNKLNDIIKLNPAETTMGKICQDSSLNSLTVVITINETIMSKINQACKW